MALAGSDHFVANFNAVQALSRSIDRVFEEAQLSGILSLSGRNLKEFPSAAGRYDLTDTVVADLSRNRLAEFPVQLCEYGSLETLILYHNCIRSIPLAVQFLASLTYLDLSRNQLVTIPSALTLLPLEVLVLNNNRIETIPCEIYRLAGTLMELDISCNRLTSLPLEIGDLGKLRVLNSRENLLSELPLTLNKLRLRTLDVSSNKLSFLDVGIRCMTTLIELHVDNNPLVFPPAKLCDRGCVHIFKSLELECTRRAKRRPQTATSMESDVLDRRRYRMTTAAVVVNGNDMKLTPTNPADYKYAMSLNTMEHRRKYRHRTIASETRFSYNASNDDCCSRWTAVTNQRPIENVDRPTVGPVLQKRSPPIGEEVPPPPPHKIESSPLMSKMSDCHRHCAASSVLPNSCSTRPETVVDGTTSLVEEVMAACRESEIMTKSGSKTTPTSENSRNSDSNGDEVSRIWRKQHEQNSVRRTNAAECVRRLQNESGTTNGTATDLQCNVSHPVTVSTFSPSTSETAVDRASSSPISTPQQHQNVRQSRRSTYSIMEELEPSPSPAITNTNYSAHPVSPNSRTDERISKSPPKSAKSNVIHSIYTASNNSSLNGKKLTQNQRDSANVHPCCPSHGTSVISAAGEDNIAATKTDERPATALHPPPKEPNQTSASNVVHQNGAERDGIKEEILANAEHRREKAADKLSRDSRQDDPSSVALSNGAMTHAIASQSVTCGTKASSSSTGSTRLENPRKNVAPTAEATKTQKRITPNVNGVIRASTSSHLIKGPSQNSLTSSASSQRLSTVAAGSKSSSAASGGVSCTNGAVGALQSSASKKMSPPSNSYQDAGKGAFVASKSVTNQKSESIGPVFNRASLAANQSRASRSRESLTNGVGPSGASTRKGELSDRNQQLIEDMRQVLEKTLKITLPSNISELSESLSDGVYLCNFVNTIRPRTIPSVHSSTDPGTKLPAAKCRRNVENFLMGCRRLGVPESQLFNVSDVADRKTLTGAAKAIQALVKQTLASNSASATAMNGVKMHSSTNAYAKTTNV